jgi:predicted small metal-binding protein
MMSLWQGLEAEATRFLRVCLKSRPNFHAFFTHGFSDSRDKHALVLCSIDRFEWTEARRRKMKTFACKDTGMQCNWTTRGQTEQEVLDKAKEHAKDTHKMNLTSEMEQTIRRLIHDE